MSVRVSAFDQVRFPAKGLPWASARVPVSVLAAVLLWALGQVPASVSARGPPCAPAQVRAPVLAWACRTAGPRAWEPREWVLERGVPARGRPAFLALGLLLDRGLESPEENTAMPQREDLPFSSSLRKRVPDRLGVLVATACGNHHNGG